MRLTNKWILNCTHFLYLVINKLETSATIFSLAMKQNPGQFRPKGRKKRRRNFSSTTFINMMRIWETRWGLGLQIVAFLLASILGREHHLQVLLHPLVALPKHSIQYGLYPRNATKYHRKLIWLKIQNLLSRSVQYRERIL